MNLKNYVTNLLGIIFWVIAIKKVWITEHPNVLFFISLWWLVLLYFYLKTEH